MTAKTNAQRQREYRKRQKALGNAPVTLTAPAEDHQLLRRLARTLRDRPAGYVTLVENVTPGEEMMLRQLLAKIRG